MSRLTDKEWVTLTRKTIDYYHTGDLRFGQSYMNALADVNFEIYKQITATEYDCFYNDNKIIKFMEFLNNAQIEVDEKI